MGRELGHLQPLVAALGPDWPVLATVFSPVTIAKKLAAVFFDHLRSHPPLIHDALEEIAATIADFAARAIGWVCRCLPGAFRMPLRTIGEAVYQDIGVPFDQAVLEGAREGWFNTVHMHGDRILFDLLATYPVQS